MVVVCGCIRIPLCALILPALFQCTNWGTLATYLWRWDGTPCIYLCRWDGTPWTSSRPQDWADSGTVSRTEVTKHYTVLYCSVLYFIVLYCTLCRTPADLRLLLPGWPGVFLRPLSPQLWRHPRSVQERETPSGCRGKWVDLSYHRRTCASCSGTIVCLILTP